MMPGQGPPREGMGAPPPAGGGGDMVEMVRRVVREEVDMVIEQIPAMVAKMVQQQMAARTGEVDIGGEVGKMVGSPAERPKTEEPVEKQVAGRPKERKRRA